MTDLLAPVSTVSVEELGRRTIRRSDWVSCNSAFIDCRTPGLGPQGELRLHRRRCLAERRPVRQPHRAARLQRRGGRDAQRGDQQPAPALHRRGLHQLRRHVPAALGRGRQAGRVRQPRRRRDHRADLDLPRLHQRGPRRRHPAHRARPRRHRRHHLGPVGAAGGGVVRSPSDRRLAADRHRRRRRAAHRRAADQAHEAALHRRADHVHRRRDAAAGDPAGRPRLQPLVRCCAPTCRAGVPSWPWGSATG